MTKRQSFIVASLLLALGLILVQSLSGTLKLEAVLGLTIVSYLFSAFVLRFDLKGVELFSLLALPTLFTLGMSLIHYTFPLTLFSRILFLAFYALVLYIILLSENIFNVSAIRTIPLFRAAQTVSLLTTLFTGFLLFIVIYKLNTIFLIPAGLSFLLAFILALQSLWALELKKKIDKEVLVTSFLIALAVGECALAISFYPLKSFLRGMALTTTLYIGLGIAYQYLQHKLTRALVIEYSVVAAATVMVLLIL